MADITKCEGTDCPIKNKCKRYTAKADEHYQSYFAIPPFKIIKGKFDCEMFWGESADLLFEELTSIIKGNKKQK